MRLLIAVLACFTIVSAQQCQNPLPYAWVPAGYCASVWASGLSAPRGILVLPNNDVLVLEQSQSRITVLFTEDNTLKRQVLTQGGGINHAIKFHNNHLYASSQTTVYRWPYTVGQRTSLGVPETIVRNIPSGGHTTRSIEFDSQLIYVQVGSLGNVDRTSIRSRVVTFDVNSVPSGGYDWNSGKIYADGLRNEVGLRFDLQGRLWGVENGCDNLQRSDLGGDIHNDNPSEEMNLLMSPGQFYGYPFCWSQYHMLINFSNPVGTQWVHPDFQNDGVHTDTWCRNRNNVVPPTYNFGAHMAPMDLTWYNGTGSWPKGDAFVSFRGSWNRNPPAGYRVNHVKFNNGLPVSDEPFLRFVGPGETGSNWPHRPVGLAWAKCDTIDCLLVTSDASGIIIAITKLA